MTAGFLAALLAAFGAPEAKKDSRPLLAIDHLRPLGVDSLDAGVLEEAISGAVQATGKARVLERFQIDKILHEQNFQKSGACEKSDCIVEVGQILGVDRIVVGSLGRMGATFSLNLRLVDITTGELLASPSRTTDQIERLLRMIPSIADELVLSAPSTAKQEAPTARPVPKGKPWIGLRFTGPQMIPAVQFIRQMKGIDDTGVVVTEVMRRSPASRAALEYGDLLQTCNGVTILGVEHFQAMLRNMAPGSRLELSGRHLDRPATWELVVGSVPKDR